MTRTKISIVIKVVALLFYFLLAVIVARAQVTSDFSVDADGWTIFNTSSGGYVTIGYSSTGGNPGGYITDGGTPSGPTILYAEAPAKFKGNHSTSYNQNLTFDLKTDFVGTNNTNGDVIITGPSGSLFYQLPSKPGASFTSYVVQLNETFAGWHFGGIASAAPTQTQMKAVLSNITSIRIRTKYTIANTSTATGSLDNVVMNVATLVSPPIITSFTPQAATAGTTLTIIGNNFNTTAAQNIVYFNGVKAVPTSATATQLTVKVPTSAAYGKVTVENLGTGLQGASPQNFNPLFDNNKDFGGRIISASMSRGYNSILQTGTEIINTYSSMDKGDFDGDGWIDLITPDVGLVKIFAYRNLGTGSFGTAAFSSAITLPSFSGIPGGGPSSGPIIVADVDSDGKLDVASISASASSGYLAVYRNTSSAVGNISFASPLFFAYPYYSSQLFFTSGDFDGDGRIDFAFTTGTSPGGIWAIQNLSTPGNVDFSYGFSVGNSNSHSNIKSADLNGDGLTEIIATVGTGIEIYTNTSSAGNVTFSSPFTMTGLTSASYLAVGDLDADSKPDLAWSAYGAQYVYFSKNNFSGGALSAASFGSQFQISSNLVFYIEDLTIADFNSDSKPDMILTGYSDLGIMQNVGATNSLNNNSFLPTVIARGSATGQALGLYSPKIADLDGDNKPDVAAVYSNNAVTAAEKGIMLFRNESYPIPTIASTSPTSAFASSTVTLSGNLMYTGSTNPSIRLNKVIAPISGSPTNTSTAVTSPLGEISGRFNITNHGLTSLSNSFTFSFNTNRVINTSSFGPSVDFALTSPKDVVETGDFDDDGKVDVVFSDGTGVGIFQNSTTAGQNITAASLTKLGTVYSNGGNAAVSDIDGDGKLDINTGYYLIQNTSSSSISFAAGLYSAAGPTQGQATADFNKDGKLDIAYTNGSINVNVYENLSSKGSFLSAANYSNYSTYAVTALALPHPTSSAFGPGNNSIVAADFDGDGYDDIAAIAQSGNNFVFFKNLAVNGPLSNSSFSSGTSITAYSQPLGITTNDFDGDGKPDIAVAHYNSANVSVYLNTSTVGTISFAVPVNLTGFVYDYNIGSQDLDGDGKPEIIITTNPNPGAGSFSIYQNKSTPGSLSFSTAVTIPLPLSRKPQAINFADINADQKPDILIVGYNGSSAPAQALMVFQNNLVTPVISVTTQPTSVYSVCDGATPTITTAATGTTNITYQWQIFNSGTSTYVDLTNTGGYSNVSTASFTINSTGNFGAGTYRCKISGDFAATVYSNTVSFSVNPLPPTPVTSNVSNCGPGTLTLSASGTTNGNYMWYDTNGLIAGQTNSTYTTPVISSTSFYSVRITNGTCVSPQVNITATINTVPAVPTTSDVNNCGATTFTLSASGTTNGNYLWYDINGVIGGQVNNTYVTPVISSTTGYSVAITNGTCVSAKVNITATINTVPTAPTTSNVNNCGATSFTLTASGTTNGNYLWYDTNGLIGGQVNSTYVTPVISSTTAYSVAITNGSCSSAKANVTATVNTVPAAPTAQSSSQCSGNAFSLTASGGTNGQYRWYTTETGGTNISGEVNSTYVTPALTPPAAYYVSINDGVCESARTPVPISFITSGCGNPVITPAPLTTQVGGTVDLNLISLITTNNNNLNVSSIVVIQQPASGAKASVNNGMLTVDYSGITFSGSEQVTIQACDTDGNCTTQIFTITVAGDIVVYNGVSPHGQNPAFIIEYIDLIPETKGNTVYIFDRWENLVWQGTNYDNQTVVFTGVSDSGKDLPSGVYYYKINFASGRKTETGFISLRRQ